MDSSTPSDAVLPRRNSVKTASPANINQLNSDSARGDLGGEFAVGSARHGASAVKRTYGKKGIGRARAASVKEEVQKPKSSLKKPRTQSSSPSPSIEPPAAYVSSKQHQKYGSSVKKARARSPSLPLFIPPTRTTTMHDEPIASTSSQQLPPPKAKAKGSRARSPSLPPPTRPRSSGAAPAHQVHEPSRSKPQPRPISQMVPASTPVPLPTSTPAPEIDDDELSDLTALSSDESTPAMSPGIIILECDPGQPLPLHSASLPTHVGSSSDQKGPKESSWSLKNLHLYVWVLIEPNSARVYNPEEDVDDNTERLWWPGKIKSPHVTDVPLKIKLFGTGMKIVELRRPCERNILSKLDSMNRWRFRTPAFVSPASLQGGFASLRKKPKLDRGDIERKWSTAVKEMKQVCEEEEGSDYFPDIGEFLTGLLAPAHTTVAHSQQISGAADKKGKRKRESASDGGVDDDMVVLEDDDLQDFGLDVPGELVLARDQPTATVDHWPAMIMAYVPPTSRKQQGKYHVTWLDNTTGDIPRSWFYTTDQDEFATCKVGQFVSQFQEVQNDDEDDQLQDLARRSPSPIPLHPPPPPQEFIQRPIREQFVYTRAVLQAILNHDYEPVKRKHRMFMNGGKERQNVLEAASLRGKMDPKDVEHLQACVREWCLRERAGGPTFSPAVELAATEFLSVPTVEDNTMTAVQADNGGDIVDLTVDDEMRSDAGASRVASPPITEPLPSSPLEMPPSSYPSTSSRLEPEDSFDVSVHPLVPDSLQPSLCFEVPAVAATEPLTAAFGLTDGMSGPTAVNKVQEEVEVVQPPGRQWCNDFEALDPKLKVDYCLNILGPESIRQVLLWRTGGRTSVELLSAEEEQELYEKGETLLQERDWVFDIMRMRERLAKKLAQIPTQEGPGRRRNGRSSRPKRNTAAVNYQE